MRPAAVTGQEAGFPPVAVTLDDLTGLRATAHAPRDLRTGGLTAFPGAIRSARRGQGLEFEDLRPYAPGDDVRHIDWNVTARTARPHVRLYAEERERALTVAVDLRTAMFTGSVRLRAARAAELAARTLWQAAAFGDRCAAVVLTDDGIEACAPRAGERGAAAACGLIGAGYASALAAHRGGGRQNAPSLADLIQWLNQAGRSAGACLVFSGCDDLDPAAISAMEEAGKRGALAVVLTFDPLEAGVLPPGRYAVEGRRLRLDRGGATAVNAALAEAAAATIRTIEATQAGLVVDDGASAAADIVGRLFLSPGRRR